MRRHLGKAQLWVARQLTDVPTPARLYRPTWDRPVSWAETRRIYARLVELGVAELVSGHVYCPGFKAQNCYRRGSAWTNHLAANTVSGRMACTGYGMANKPRSG